MKAIHALYQDGNITFPWQPPDYDGPVAVLIIFPDTWPEEFEADLVDWDIHGEEIPF